MNQRFFEEITVQEPILCGQTVWVSSFKSHFKPMTSRRTDQRRKPLLLHAFTIKYKDTMLWQTYKKRWKITML